MPSVMESFDRDDLVRRYEAGASFHELAQICGSSVGTVYRFFKLNNLPIRSKNATAKLARHREAILAEYQRDANTAAIARKYGVDIGTVIPFLRKHGLQTYRRRVEDLGLASPAAAMAMHRRGIPVLQIADAFGVSRSCVCRMLTEAGITPRGASEAERIKWRRIKQSPEAVRRQLSAAWKAGTGPVGRYEREVLESLCGMGIHAVPQRCIRKHPVDIAVEKGRVAIEIQRSRMNNCGSMRRERLEEILDAGWMLLIVYTPKAHPLDVAAVTKKCVSLIERRRSDPSLAGQYGVIGRNGKPATPRSFDFNSRPRIPGA